MTRRYDGPRLTHGKVHYPGKAGHLNQATSPSTPKLANGAISEPKGNFAGSIKPGAKLPTKAAQPAGPMLPQNVGKGLVPAPTPRAQQPRHSVMKAPSASDGGQRPSKEVSINRDTLTVKQPAPKPANTDAAQARDLKAAQAAHRAHQREKRGFGRDAQGNPFKASH
jgi:hypothetical protein